MARALRLKVYRTPIGFHDAYVAAPSRKAALKAWGTTDLFARGIAETVDDPDLMREPLAKPGIVIKRSRGTAAEQIAALPPDRRKPDDGGGKRKTDTKAPVHAKPRTKPKPRPSRSALDAPSWRSRTRTTTTKGSVPRSPNGRSASLANATHWMTRTTSKQPILRKNGRQWKRRTSGQ